MYANVANPPMVDRVASVNAMLWNARGEVGCFINPPEWLAQTKGLI